MSLVQNLFPSKTFISINYKPVDCFNKFLKNSKVFLKIMTSDNYNHPVTSSSLNKTKRTRKFSQISLESGQHSIASAMARIVKHMVNKELQQRCKDLLEMEDLAETEARILFVLQQIDKEKEEEEKIKEESKKRRLKSKLEKENKMKDENSN